MRTVLLSAFFFFPLSLVHFLQWSPRGNGDFCSRFCHLGYSGMFLCIVLKSSMYLFPVVPVTVSLNLFREWSCLKGLLGSRTGGGFQSAFQGMEGTGGSNEVLLRYWVMNTQPLEVAEIITSLLGV